MSYRLKITTGSRYVTNNIGLRDWTPSEISTNAWFDASNSNSLTLVSGRVSQWNDLSSNGNNLTQGNSGNRPYSETQTIGGRNVIEFIQSQSTFMSKTDNSSLDFDSSNGHSYFFVGRRGEFNNIGSGVNSIWGKGATSSSEIGYGMLFTTTSTSFNCKAGINRTLSFFIDLRHINFMCSQINVTTGASGGGIQRLYLNGQFINSSSNDTGLSDNSQNLFVGRDSNPNRYSNSWIGELIIIAGAVNDNIRQKIEGYLAWKWGLQNNLSSSHPYKNEKPYVRKI